MASVLGVSLTSSLLPLFSSKSNTQTKSSSRNVFLHPNGLKSNNFSCSGLKLNVGTKRNSVIVRCESDAVAEIEATETSSENYEYQAEGATIDLKLPRRSLLAHFMCNACGVRSQKLINRLAYEKGTAFVQCTGCSQYHKLVDNLNLVVEYNFKEEVNTSPDADQL
ncbi:uncharacterized protein [Rutidosis leptorrhynchoides]|uniref:uncharacterized protein n=1 Tax=Rutidosis leptorrhynchoides TaxID=125765 RepID=UPI003A99D238